jgi:N-hydroxyarylamine O-acetyltransferase
LDAGAISDYLDRIGAMRPAVLDGQALRELHQAHLLTVPFENLSIHLGEPISLAEDDLLDKIVRRRRGGFCYELNGAFALLLEGLGAPVQRLAARVYGADGPGPPFDHLALVVKLADGSGPWLADVGFGAHSSFPLRLGSSSVQHDPGGEFALIDAVHGDLEVRKDGAPQYLLERRPRSLAEFGPTCWWQQHHPDSHFRKNTICSLLTADGRISIAGRTLIQTSAAERRERELVSDAELLAAYMEHFRIRLDRVPART